MELKIIMLNEINQTSVNSLFFHMETLDSNSYVSVSNETRRGAWGEGDALRDREKKGEKEK